MRQKIAAAVSVALLTAGLIVLVVWWLPPQLMLPFGGTVAGPPPAMTSTDFLKAENDIRHSLVETLQLIATTVTAIGLVFTLYFTAKNVIIAEKNSERSVEASERTLEAQRQSRLGDRFSKAAEQLSNSDVAVCVGGIYALSRIAKESKEDYWPVAHLLCTFLRSKRPIGQKRAPGKVAPADDVKAVAAFFRMGLDVPDGAVDLSMTNLHAMDLSKGIFRNANFDGAELDGTVLARADLTKASFAGVNATGAIFTRARLLDCFMSGMNLTQARMTMANLRGASVDNAIVIEVIGPILNVTEDQRKSVKDGNWDEVPP